MSTTNGGPKRKKSAQDEVAYEYLCRLEEAKKWLESVLEEDLAPTTELEDALQNGVYLCRIGMILLPQDEMWKKVYDLDQSKFKAKGLDYRYTDNINFWLKSLSKLGLPKVFYPVMTDIFHKKDMPKLVYCLHALSHLMKKRGLVRSAVDDLYGSAKFPHDALVQTTQTLKRIKYHEMPAFGMVENLVDEELQYLAMGLCDSYEEDVSRSPSLVMANPEEAMQLFDDPTYISSKKKAELNVEDQEKRLLDLKCVSSDLTVTLYSYSIKTREQLSPIEQALRDFNMQLSLSNAESTFTALKAVVKLVDDKSILLFKSYTEKYHQAFIEEKKAGIPVTVLPVYSGLDREACDGFLDSMSPGAYLVRDSKTIEGAYVFSFRNQTGIKHWKLSTKGGKFYWGTSSLYSTLGSFVQHFVEALSQVTKLHVYRGINPDLQPLVQTIEEQIVMDTLNQGEEDLSFGQVHHVIRNVNTEVRKEKKSIHGEHQPESLSDVAVWDSSMIIKVKKVEAERLLNSKGEKGSFLVRPSERSQGDSALAFRTHNDIRHWRIVNKGNKFFVHPRPNPYDSLADIIAHFQEAVAQETGLKMVPLLHSHEEEEEEEEEEGELGGGERGTGSGSRLEENGPVAMFNGHDTLAPVHLASTNMLAVRPSHSMSRLNPANLTSWSVDDVCFWLVSESLGNFVETFRDNEVDGECLLTLDNKLLKDDLGITALGHRSRVLKRVQVLKNEFQPH